ncbi:MAG: DHHA1 domain-containing protein [Armatimonadota bacterium]|nr:DHHA1 domain-containing protein [Armatimonadota bacterium]
MSRITMSRGRDRAIALIRKSKSIYVGTHVRPDGDALGSALALSLALDAQGKRVATLCADPVPVNYRFLPAADRISAAPPQWPAELGIVVDCDGLTRVGPLHPAFEQLPHLIDIDHHATDQSFGEVRLVDSSAAATAEIVHGLLRSSGAEIGGDIAICLYAAILTDTGRFSYGNTTAHSLTVAAEMVRAGADPHDIARRIYEERSVRGTHLLGVALTRLSPNHDSEIVSSTLTRRDFAETGAKPGDTEGIIDHLRAIGGRRVALLFVEVDAGQVRVSLRSDGSVDVSAIALAFGGGGHAMAAGCAVRGSTEQVQDKVLAAVRNALKGSSLAHGA